jgi:hypothetical protein
MMLNLINFFILNTNSHKYKLKKMTWHQEVSLILLDILSDPEIIIYLMKIVKQKHYQFMFSEARKFHESLRITRAKRWLMSKELSEQGNFYKMNTYVPINCTLPFDNGMWLRSQNIIRKIHYFRKNFIRITYLINDASEKEMTMLNYPRASINWFTLTGSSVTPNDWFFGEWDAPISTKIKSVNLIFDETTKGSNFRTNIQQREIQYTLADMIRQDDNIWSEAPYLLIHSPIVSYETKKIINNSIIPNPTYGDFYIGGIIN